MQVAIETNVLPGTASRGQSRSEQRHTGKHLSTPSGSKTTFPAELDDLISTVGVDAEDKFVICGDFNLPGEDSKKIDSRLDSLFDVHGLKQHVASTNLHDKRTGRENMLDLLVTAQSSNIVHELRVETSHYLYDHAFVTCHFSCHRVNLPPTTYQYRDIKQLDLDTFQRRLKLSTLITSTFNAPDEYLDEIQ